MTTTADFTALYTQHRPMVARIIGNILRRTNEVEDVVQNTFLKALRSQDSFSGRSSYSSWLTSIAMNEAFDFLRRKKRKPVVLECDLASDSSYHVITETILDPVISAEVAIIQRETIRLTMRRVGVSDRKILQAIYFHGSNYAEVAEACGITQQALKTRLFRAVRRARGRV